MVDRFAVLAIFNIFYQSWKSGGVDGLAEAAQVEFGVETDSHEAVLVEVVKAEIADLATRDDHLGTGGRDGRNFLLQHVLFAPTNNKRGSTTLSIFI